MIDYYRELVPKEIDENLRFRREVLQMAIDDDRPLHDPEGVRYQLWLMCSRDLLFWLNTFVWTHDPRLVTPAVPFLSYGYQDEGYGDLGLALGSHDLGIEKSRDMGASWMILMLYLHGWLFRPMSTYLLVSRNEDLVDKRDDPDCLFAKLDFAMKRLPNWMLPAHDRRSLILVNKENESSIVGASTTSDTARGGRRTSIMLDEFASVPDGYSMLSATRDVTNNRMFNSTPKGMGNAFAELMHESDIKKLRFHWTRHPVKAEGLYTLDEKPMIGGKVRSPWYDEQCRRTPNDKEIAQELDIDYHGSDYLFFEPQILERHRNEHASEPWAVGELMFDEQSFRPADRAFSPGERGRLKLWCHLDHAGRPPSDRSYVVGCDVSAGTGASNSVISVMDLKAKRLVAQWVSPRTRPEAMAGWAVALARWFADVNNRPALLIWEANGPGRNFGDRVLESGFRAIYYRRNDKQLAKPTSTTPGWWATPETKLMLLSEYRRSMAENEVVIPEREELEECRYYVFQTNGTVAHSKSVDSLDPSGARSNHGDRPTATALCLEGARGRGEMPDREEPEIPVGSFLHRRERRRREMREAASGDFWSS